MKAFMISASLLAVIGWASCEKTQEHNCVCLDSQGDVAQTYTYADMSREEARDLCAESAVELNDSDTTGQTYLCTLD